MDDDDLDKALKLRMSISDVFEIQALLAYQKQFGEPLSFRAFLELVQATGAHTKGTSSRQSAVAKPPKILPG